MALDFLTGTNSTSLHDSLERNWEYFENLRRCYDPDNIVVSPSFERRSRSDDSTPDPVDVLKSKLHFLKQSACLVKENDIKYLYLF